MTEFTVTVQEGTDITTYFCAETPRYVAKYIEGEDIHVKGMHVRDVALKGIEFVPTNGPAWRKGSEELRHDLPRLGRHRTDDQGLGGSTATQRGSCQRQRLSVGGDADQSVPAGGGR
jgi:hypothetical protein